MNRRELVTTTLVVALILAAGWAGTRYLRARQQQAAVSSAPAAVDAGTATVRLLSNPAAMPAFAIKALDGRTLKSDDFRGKVVIVNFWATWCPPCRAEIPDLIALQKRYPNQVQVIGISQDEAGPDVVRKFVSDQQMNYPVAMSTPDIEKKFPGIYALPTSFIVSPDGKIMQKHVGMLNAQVTDTETRALSGLDRNVKVEYVEDETKAMIRNAAQATKIPGVDLDKLTNTQKTAALKRLNEDTCTCGCGLTLAACRINDPNCSISLPLAQKIVEDAAHQ